jgi:hypothetical protein
MRSLPLKQRRPIVRYDGPIMVHLVHGINPDKEDRESRSHAERCGNRQIKARALPTQDDRKCYVGRERRNQYDPEESPTATSARRNKLLAQGPFCSEVQRAGTSASAVSMMARPAITRAVMHRSLFKPPPAALPHRNRRQDVCEPKPQLVVGNRHARPAWRDVEQYRQASIGRPYRAPWCRQRDRVPAT